MMRKIQSAIKQAILSKSFLLGLIGVIVVVFASSISDILDALRTKELLTNGFHHNFIDKAILSDAMTLAMPIIAALPFTASFVNDIKSGFIKCYLHRTSRKNYIIGKSIACGISGGLVLVLGIGLAYVISLIVFLPGEGSHTFTFYKDFVIKMVSIFLSGAFWSLCGLTFSTMTNSKYMAYASPFIIYYVLIILYERYFDKLYVLYPKNWIQGDFGVIALLLGLIIAISAVFFCTTKRRISQL